MNQTLEGHEGHVISAVWNQQYQKLTTADANGLIIVWVLYNGGWVEEMINNRNKSFATCMQWSQDGKRICIIYEDGGIIMGSVDGNRIWGKDFHGRLSHVAWAPDGRFLILASQDGKMQLMSEEGVILTRITNFYDPNSKLKVVGIEWFKGQHGFNEKKPYCLAIIYEDGKMQLMRSHNDQCNYSR